MVDMYQGILCHHVGKYSNYISHLHYWYVRLSEYCLRSNDMSNNLSNTRFETSHLYWLHLYIFTPNIESVKSCNSICLIFIWISMGTANLSQINNISHSHIVAHKIYKSLEWWCHMRSLLTQYENKYIYIYTLPSI